MHVLITRDRAAAGGGIHGYYEALRPHLTSRCEFVDVGQAYRYYQTSAENGASSATLLRLLKDYTALLCGLLRFPDLVHVNPGLDVFTRRSLRRDAVSLWLAKLFRRPVLVFWRGWDQRPCATSFPGGDQGWLYRTYRLADAHVVLAAEFKRQLRTWNFQAPIHLETTVVSDGILSRAAEAPRSAVAPISLLFLSRMDEDKGLVDLLEVYKLLESKQPRRYRLTFAGDGPCLETLRARVRDQRIAGVSFPGFLSGEPKIRAYLDASIFCFLSSHGEGMPNAVLEAMAMGLPVVSSDVGGLKDILRDGETGFVLSPRADKPPGERFSVEEVADRIEILVNARDLYARISSHNRRLAAERFAAPKVAQRLEAIYRATLAGMSRRALRTSR